MSELDDDDAAHGSTGDQGAFLAFSVEKLIEHDLPAWVDAERAKDGMTVWFLAERTCYLPWWRRWLFWWRLARVTRRRAKTIEVQP